MKLDKLGRKRIETCKNKGGSDNRPNIFSLSQTEKIVNQEIVINYNFCILFKIKLCTLYNTPPCIFEKPWYDKHTKR